MAHPFRLQHWYLKDQNDALVIELDYGGFFQLAKPCPKSAVIFGMGDSHACSPGLSEVADQNYVAGFASFGNQ